MTLSQYNFVKNIRIIVIIIGLGWLIFGAGAVFTGYKPTLPNYIVLAVVVLNLFNAFINKPAPPRHDL